MEPPEYQIRRVEVFGQWRGGCLYVVARETEDVGDDADVFVVY